MKKYNLIRTAIEPREVVGFDQERSKPISEVASFSLDIGGCEQEVFLYIVPKLGQYDLILGLPWMKAYDVRLRPKRCSLKVGGKTISIRNERTRAGSPLQCAAISASAFYSHLRTKKKIEVFSASMADIQKALKTKTKTDPRTKLPQQYYDYLDVFDQKAAEKLPPARGPGRKKAGTDLNNLLRLKTQQKKKYGYVLSSKPNLLRQHLLVQAFFNLQALKFEKPEKFHGKTRRDLATMVANTHGARGGTVRNIVKWEKAWVQHRVIPETQAGKHKHKFSWMDDEELMFEAQGYIKSQGDS